MRTLKKKTPHECSPDKVLEYAGTRYPIFGWQTNVITFLYMRTIKNKKDTARRFAGEGLEIYNISGWQMRTGKKEDTGRMFSGRGLET